MRYTLRGAIAVAGLCAGAVFATAVLPSSAVAATTKVTTTKPVTGKELSLKDQVLTDARTSILALATKSGPNDGQFMADGRFQWPGGNCPRCELGPAVAAAALYKRTGDKQMLNITTTVFDTAIKNQQQPSGSYTKTGSPGESNATIQTILFAQHLGATLTYLGTSLDTAHRTAYKASLGKAADWLAASGVLTYYINGNLNLAATEAFGLAWKQTGQAKYQAYYEKSMAFTLNPGGSWSRFGLKTSKVGKLSLGRDTAGYLAEEGALKAGFDPEYGVFQADIASQAYLLLGDQRFLTVANELVNQLWPRVNKQIWIYDTTGGSRHNRTTGADRFTTPALWIGALNGRPENKALAQSQMLAVTRLMVDSTYNAWSPIYQSWGSQFATFIATVQ